MSACVCVCDQLLSPVQLFATPQTVVHKAPLSMGFSRQEYWSRLLFPPSEDLPTPGIKPVSLVFLILSGELFTIEPPGRPEFTYC